MIENWAYFFREAKNLNVVPPALSERALSWALDVARGVVLSVRWGGVRPREWPSRTHEALTAHAGQEDPRQT
jgi:hypothetical protein